MICYIFVFIWVCDFNFFICFMVMEQVMMVLCVFFVVNDGFNKVDVKEFKFEVFIKLYCEFMIENFIVFYVVGYFKEKFVKVGYKEFFYCDSWIGKLEFGGKYYVICNGSFIIVFVVGKVYKFGNGVVMIVGYIDVFIVCFKFISMKLGNNGYV